MTKKKSSTLRGQSRDGRNKEAGLVKISPSYWVIENEKSDALADIKKSMKKYQTRARKALKPT